MKEDTNKVKILNKLCWEYKRKDLDKAMLYVKQGLSLAEKIDFKIGIARSLNNIGDIYTRKGNYEAAIENHLNALKVVKKLGSKLGIASCLNNVGIAYLYQGDYEKGLDHHLQALKIYEEVEDKNGIAACLNNIGYIYKHQSKYETAIKQYRKALRIYEELLETIHTGRNSYEIRKYKRNSASCLNNIGFIYVNLENYEKASNYFLQSLKIKEELGDKQGIAMTLDDIGTVYREQHDYEKALEYSLQSLKMLEELSDKQGLAINLNNIGKIYLGLGNYHQARGYSKRSLAIAKEIGAKDQVKHAYGSLAEAYSKQNKGEKALEYFKLYDAMKDSLLNEESNKQINELQTKYESEKKQKEIELLKKEKQLQDLDIKKNRITFYAITGGFGLVLILVFVVLRGFRRKKKLAEMKSDFINNMAHEFRTPIANISLALDTIDKQNTSEKATFNSILSIIREESSRIKDNVDLVLNISLLEDNQLKYSRERVNMNELIEKIIKTFELKLLDKGGIIKDSLKAENDELVVDETHITNMIINLIDNAIKYSKGKPLITVYTYNNNGDFCLIITDKGIGMSEETRKLIFEKFYRVPTGKVHNISGFGLGLSYVKHIVKVHKGQIKVESKLNKGSKFEIIFPLKTNN